MRSTGRTYRPYSPCPARMSPWSRSRLMVEFTSNPIDQSLKSSSQVPSGHVAQFFAGGCNLARGGAYVTVPEGTSDDRFGCAGSVRQHCSDVQDRCARSGADVEQSARGGSRGKGCHQHVDDILDVDEITDDRPVLIDGETLAT